MILRLLNWQGIAGLVAALCLGLLLLVQKGETRHWKKQSGAFEQLYHQEQAAFAQTVVNYRAAADQARAADQANAARVVSEQKAINERTSDDYEKRLAAARARADQLHHGAQAAADPGAGGAAHVPGVPAAAAGAGQAAGQDRLPQSDALTATEQAIQLDELIKWAVRQHAIDVNAARPATPTDASGNADQPPR